MVLAYKTQINRCVHMYTIIFISLSTNKEKLIIRISKEVENSKDRELNRKVQAEEI